MALDTNGEVVRASPKSTPRDPIKASITALSQRSRCTPRRVIEPVEASIDALAQLDLNDDAALIHEALTSTKKRRKSFLGTPFRSSEEDDSFGYSPDESGSPGRAPSDDEEDNADWDSTMDSLREDLRDRLLAAMLLLLNAADADLLQRTLTGIGPVRAAKITELRASTHFRDVHDVLGALGLSAKQSNNLILSNMRQILQC